MPTSISGACTAPDFLVSFLDEKLNVFTLLWAVLPDRLQIVLKASPWKMIVATGSHPRFTRRPDSSRTRQLQGQSVIRAEVGLVESDLRPECFRRITPLGERTDLPGGLYPAEKRRTHTQSAL